jgi:hypothetical protein
MMQAIDFFTVCATICALALFAAITFFHYTESNLMARNIESAIEKGIDPLSVRCSYAKQNDTICIVFASKQSQSMIQSK